MAAKRNAKVQVAVETEDKCIQTDFQAAIAPDASVHAVVYGSSEPDASLEMAYKQSVPIELLQELNEEPSAVPLTFAADVAQQKSVFVVRPGVEPDDGSRALLLTNVEIMSPECRDIFLRQKPYVEIRVIQPSKSDHTSTGDDKTEEVDVEIQSVMSSASIEVIFDSHEQVASPSECSIEVLRVDDPRAEPSVRARALEELQRVQAEKDQKAADDRRKRSLEELMRVRALKKKKTE